MTHPKRKQPLGYIERAYRTRGARRLLAQEAAVMDASELVWSVMKVKKLSKHTVARRLGLTTHQFLCMLDGDRRLTVRRLSDVFYAMGLTLRFRFEPAREFPTEEGP